MHHLAYFIRDDRHVTYSLLYDLVAEIVNCFAMKNTMPTVLK